MDSQLLLNQPKAVVVRTAFHTIMLRISCTLSRIRRHCTVPHALVISWVDYFNTLYMGLPPLKKIWKLQLVQGRLAETIMGLPWEGHITSLLHEPSSLDPSRLPDAIQVLGISYKALMAWDKAI